MAIRFAAPLEDIPEETPTLLERMSLFLSNYVERKDLLNDYEKDRVALMKGKQEMEEGTLAIEKLGPESVPLVVGLLLLHLKFQTEPLMSSAVYEQCCQTVLQTKGSTALCGAFQIIIDNLRPQRRRTVRAFFRYLWQCQNFKTVNGLDSIALATRFGNYIIRPPSGTEPTLSRVKLMGALAILIESYPKTESAAASSAPGALSSVATLNALSPNSSGALPAPSLTAAPPSAMPPTLSVPSAFSEGVSSPSESSGNEKATVRSGPSSSVSGVAAAGIQISEVARSAVVVTDSVQKTLVKLKASTEKCDDPVRLLELLKRLNYIESLCDPSPHNGEGWVGSRTSQIENN